MVSPKHRIWAFRALAVSFTLFFLLPAWLMAQIHPSDRISLEDFIANSAPLKKDAHRDTIDARKFAELLDSEPRPLLIDVRSAYEFSRAHLKGAINLPEPDLTEPQIEKYVPSKDFPILLYCQNAFFPSRRIDLTHTAYLTLRQLGYSRVYILSPVWGSPGSKKYLQPLIEGPFAEELLPGRNTQENPE